MTNEEKKEFEDFLEWKKQRQAVSADGATDTSPTDNGKESTSTISKSSSQSDNTKNSPSNTRKTQPKKQDGDLNIGCLVAACCGLFLLIIFLLFIGTQGSGDSSGSSDSSVIASDSILSDSTTNSEVHEPVNITGWKRYEDIDEMDGSTSVWCSITSTNYVNLSFPYKSAELKIVVRKTKEFGTDVYIRTSSGQIFGLEHNNDNYVRIRFDNKQPMKFFYNKPSDNSFDVVFLRNTKKFIAEAKKAEQIIVEVPFYQDGRCLFYFSPLIFKLEWP